jgi:hypothetical protein
MLCKEFAVELEAAGLEEHLSPAAVAHLDQCAHCSGLVADLKAIQSASLELAEVEPPQRIWVALRNQLELEGLIRESVAEVVTAGSRRSLWFRLRPAMAGVYLAALLLFAGLVSMRMSPPEPAAPETIAGTAVVLPPDLSASSNESALTLRERNPVVTASYTQSLEIIDNFIRLCEKTVREEPNNEAAREYLYDAYQQKAAVLAMSMERGAWGD